MTTSSIENETEFTTNAPFSENETQESEEEGEKEEEEGDDDEIGLSPSKSEQEPFVSVDGALSLTIQFNLISFLAILEIL